MSRVTSETHEGVVIVRMDDGKANAINGDLLDELDAAMDAAESANAAVVLTGRGGFFSGGLDLKTLPTLGSDDLTKVLRQFGATMLRMFSYRRPLIAASTGHALAGGMVTLLTADERYSAPGPFKLGLNETQIGMSLPKFVVEMARAQLAANRMHEVVVQGAIYGPERAVELGAIDGVTDDVVAHAVQRAKALSVLPASSFGDNKLSVRGPFHDVGKTAYAAEIEQFMGNFAVAAKARS